MSDELDEKWLCRLDSLRPMSGWPDMNLVARESRHSPSYYFEGRERSGPTYVFQYTLSGCGRFRYGDELYLLPAGVGFWVDVADPLVSYYYDASETEPWDFLYVDFRLESSAMLDSFIEAFGPVHQVPLSSYCIQEFLALEHHAQVNLTPLESFRLFSSFTQSLLDAHSMSREDVNPLLSEAQELLLQREHLHWNATQLAKKLNVSREHLTRVFQKELGMTPYHYIQDRRIQAAKMLLQRNHLSVKQIANECGFDSPSLFGKVFKASQAVTPLRYRVQHGGAKT